MMGVLSFLWTVPAVLALIGLGVAAALARRAADEAMGLQRDLGRWGELRPVLVETRELTDETAAALRSMRKGR
jgi:cytochrome c-type biogenesis protein CcmH/NrfF